MFKGIVTGLATVVIVAMLLQGSGVPGASAVDPNDRTRTATRGAERGAAVGPDARIADAERDTILDLVREHRQGASEAWQETLVETVHRESVSAGIDPLIVAAIVARESSFRTRVHSRVGAVGLMQLLPWVARDVARRHGVEWDGPQTLYRPDVNVRLGIRYYRELIEDFDGDFELALLAYNRGPTRLRSEIRKGELRSTRYADRVLGLYWELDARRTTRLTARG